MMDKVTATAAALGLHGEINAKHSPVRDPSSVR